MKKIRIFLCLVSLVVILFTLCGCLNEEDVGRICMGDDFDTLFEELPPETRMKVRRGDIIATKYPGLWLDFNYPVAYNNFNSAIGKFAGYDRVIIQTNGELTTINDFSKRLKAKE
jgi:hypothetical protein